MEKKKILLIGDSVRAGYDRYVKESMADVAEVYYPGENCRFAEYILRTLHMWTDELGLFDADAVHWNVGLWDTLRIYGDEPLTSPAAYAENIERITKRLQFLFPCAKLIFATSTPVLEYGYIDGFEMRYNRDIERYNAIACEVVSRYGTTINDLYGLLKDRQEEYHSDQSHYYTAAGTELIGGRVNAVLCEALGIDPARLTPPDPNGFVRKDVPWDTEAYEKHGIYWGIRRSPAK